MKPRRSRRASGGGQTIGRVLEGELSSEEWENVAWARGRAAWAGEAWPTRVGAGGEDRSLQGVRLGKEQLSPGGGEI